MILLLIATLFSFSFCSNIDVWTSDYERDLQLLSQPLNVDIIKKQLTYPWIIRNTQSYPIVGDAIPAIKEMLMSRVSELSKSFNDQLLIFSKNHHYHSYLMPLIEYAKNPSSFYIGLQIDQKVNLNFDLAVDGFTPFEWALKSGEASDSTLLLLSSHVEKLKFSDFIAGMTDLLEHCAVKSENSMDHDNINLLSAIIRKKDDWHHENLIGLCASLQENPILPLFLKLLMEKKPDMKAPFLMNYKSFGDKIRLLILENYLAWFIPHELNQSYTINEVKEEEVQVVDVHSEFASKSLAEIQITSFKYCSTIHDYFVRMHFLSYCKDGIVKAIKNIREVPESSKPLKDINFECHGHWPLSVSVIAKKEDVFDAICEWNPDFSKRNTKNQNILHFACQSNFTAILKLNKEILKQLASIKDIQNHIPLHYCLVNGYAELAKSIVLLSPLANLLSSTSDYSSAMIEILNEGFAHFEPLLSEAMLLKSMPTFLELLSFVDINKPFILQYTPLQFAISINWKEAIDVLLDSKANPFVPSRTSRNTCFHLLAIKKDWNLMADLILKCGGSFKTIFKTENAEGLTVHSLMPSEMPLLKFLFWNRSFLPIDLHFIDTGNPIQIIFDYGERDGMKSKSRRIEKSLLIDHLRIFPLCKQVLFSIHLYGTEVAEGLFVEMTIFGPMNRQLGVISSSFSSQGHAVFDISSNYYRSPLLSYSIKLINGKKNAVSVKFLSVQATKFDVNKDYDMMRNDYVKLIGFQPSLNFDINLESTELTDWIALGNEQDAIVKYSVDIQSLLNPPIILSIIVSSTHEKSHVLFEPTKVTGINWNGHSYDITPLPSGKKDFTWAVIADRNNDHSKRYPKMVSFNVNCMETAISKISTDLSISIFYDLTINEIRVPPRSRVKLVAKVIGSHELYRQIPIRNLVLKVHPVPQ